MGKPDKCQHCGNRLEDKGFIAVGHPMLTNKYECMGCGKIIKVKW